MWEEIFIRYKEDLTDQRNVEITEFLKAKQIDLNASLSESR